MCSLETLYNYCGLRVVVAFSRVPMVVPVHFIPNIFDNEMYCNTII